MNTVIMPQQDTRTHTHTHLHTESYNECIPQILTYNQLRETADLFASDLHNLRGFIRGQTCLATCKGRW